MEAKAEETLKPSEAGLREGTPTDIPLVRRTANPLQKLLRANGDCAKNVPEASELNDVSSPSVTAVTKSVLMLIELRIIRSPLEALVAIGALHRVVDAETALSGRRSARRERAS